MKVKISVCKNKHYTTSSVDENPTQCKVGSSCNQSIVWSNIVELVEPSKIKTCDKCGAVLK